MPRATYRETFDAGPGGWWGWISNFGGPKPLELFESSAISRGPWWVDYNHAPPGAGYLHMVYSLGTTEAGLTDAILETGGLNRFVEGKFPTNFTNARVTARLKGELETRGAQLVLLAQGAVGAICSGWALTSSPFVVKPEWTEQSITLAPDAALWTCLGSRHDRTQTYGRIELDTILRDVNANIMLILFPLTVVPMGPRKVDPYIQRAGRDYPVWQSRLPDGYVMLDEITIEFP